VSTRRTAFAKPFVWWVRDALDLEAMRTAAAPLVGLSDFRSFTDDDPEEKSTRVLVEGVEIAQHDALVLVRVAGSHFLWKMVRRLVGVLVAVGRGDLDPSALAGWLTQESGVPAELTAPASGLFLEHVAYAPDERPRALAPAVVTVR
jgi:tRNA pseudouridine38-40 synthase